METQNHPRSRYAGKALLIGTALTVALVAPIAGSAALDSGSFFIYAYNDQEPEIDARAGLNGLASNPGGGNPGGENPDNSLASTITCGDQSITVTQEMLDFSDANRAAAARGESPQPYSDGGWYYIWAGSYAQASLGSQVPGLDSDLAYVFSNSPVEVSAKDFVYLGVDGHMSQLRVGSKLIGEFENEAFRGADGDSISVIGELSLDGTKYCNYAKFEDAKLSSSTNDPAYFALDMGLGGSPRTVYAKNGSPAFGPERASHIQESFGSRTEIFYNTSNGERWDYKATKGSTWHPHQLITQSPNKLPITSIWTECFGDDCADRLANATIEKRSDPNPQSNVGDGSEHTIVTYVSPQKLHGSDTITLLTRTNGNPFILEYKDSSLAGSGVWEFSRTNGYATYSWDAEGKLYNTAYAINGIYHQKQSSYEAAGGTNWQDNFYYGEQKPYMGD